MHKSDGFIWPPPGRQQRGCLWVSPSTAEGFVSDSMAEVPALCAQHSVRGTRSTPGEFHPTCQSARDPTSQSGCRANVD